MDFRTFFMEEVKKDAEEFNEQELEMGHEVEKEHKDVYDLFEKWSKENDLEMPITEDDLYDMISKAHLRELPDYYTKLKAMESKGSEEKSEESVKESENLTENTRVDVIKMFLDDSFPHSKEEALEMGIKHYIVPWPAYSNLRITKKHEGWSLVNYSTPILYRSEDGTLYYNSQKYSVTTSKIQSWIRRALEGIDFIEVDGKEIEDLVQGKTIEQG